MAERRMFAKTVTDDDSFIMMPATTQNLYFHLAMKADDDGFVNSPKSIIRLIGANENDFDVLILKRFVLKFDTGVIVIRHWKIHNYIQKDRYKETRYLQEKKLLQENPNREYVEKAHVSTTDTGCIQSVHGMDAQIRIDKNSQDEISQDEIIQSDDDIKPKKQKKDTDENFDIFWAEYPKKVGKSVATASWVKINPDKELFDKIMLGLKNYKSSKQWAEQDGRFINNPSTWLNQKRWEDELNCALPKRKEKILSD